jgi:hypothetical protein
MMQGLSLRAIFGHHFHRVLLILCTALSCYQVMSIFSGEELRADKIANDELQPCVVRPILSFSQRSDYDSMASVSRTHGRS